MRNSYLSAEQLYNKLSEIYKSTDEDWNEWVRQTQTIQEVLLREYCPNVRTILDCAAGIGTQSLIYSSMGYEVTATDISEKSLVKLENEARNKNLDVVTKKCEWSNLANIFSRESFDLVVCFANSLAHCPDNKSLVEAVSNMSRVLKKDGKILLSVRDYDVIIKERITGTPADRKEADIYYQEWEWVDNLRYHAEWFIRAESQGKTLMRAICKEEIIEIGKLLDLRVKFRKDLYEMVVVILTK